MSPDVNHSSPSWRFFSSTSLFHIGVVSRTTEPNVKTCGRNHSLCQKCAKVKEYLNRLGEKLDRFGTSLSDNFWERWCLYFSKKWASDCEPSSVALAASTILLKCACCSGAKLVFWQTFLGVIERLQSSCWAQKKTSPRISQTCFGENNFLPTRIGIWLGGQESSLHILLVDDQATPVRTPKKNSTPWKWRNIQNLPICQQPTLGSLGGIAVAFPESAWIFFSAQEWCLSLARLQKLMLGRSQQLLNGTKWAPQQFLRAQIGVQLAKLTKKTQEVLGSCE